MPKPSRKAQSRNNRPRHLPQEARTQAGTAQGLSEMDTLPADILRAARDDAVRSTARAKPLFDALVGKGHATYDDSPHDGGPSRVVVFSLDTSGPGLLAAVRGAIRKHEEQTGEPPASITMPADQRRALGEWCAMEHWDGVGWDPLGEFRIDGVLIEADKPAPESCPGEEGNASPKAWHGGDVYTTATITATYHGLPAAGSKAPHRPTWSAWLLPVCFMLAGGFQVGVSGSSVWGRIAGGVLLVIAGALWPRKGKA